MAPEQKSKNNVIRLLESRNIPYKLFNLPPKKFSAIETAGLLNISPECMFKTIVIIREQKNRAILVLVPATHSANLKKIAFAMGEKKVQPASLKEAEQLTHLKTGGISPLALLNTGFPILLDNSALKLAELYLSAGERGMIIRMTTSALINLTNARVGDFSQTISAAD